MVATKFKNESNFVLYTHNNSNAEMKQRYDRNINSTTKKTCILVILWKYKGITFLTKKNTKSLSQIQDRVGVILISWLCNDTTQGLSLHLWVSFQKKHTQKKTSVQFPQTPYTHNLECKFPKIKKSNFQISKNSTKKKSKFHFCHTFYWDITLWNQSPCHFSFHTLPRKPK